MFTRMLICSSVAMITLASSAGTAYAGGGNSNKIKPDAPLVGSWVVRITPYDCATLQEFTAAAFTSYMTFNDGGTMTETTSNPSFQPGQRSPGLGYWERSDRNSYRAVFRAFVQFNSVNPAPPAPPYQRGVQTVDQGIQMQNDDQWTSDAVVTFVDGNGNIVPPPVVPPGTPVKPGCMHAAATRME